MNTLSSDARLPLYQRLRDHLVEQIANNRWRPGEAIPTEAVLSAEYELSTGTVRKAVDALVSEGILERQQGRGTFVRRPQFQSSAVSEALGLASEAQVIRIVRTRLFDVQPLLAEEIWLPRARFQALLDIDLSAQGPLLYPVYESVCGQVVASAEETLTAESVNEVYARLLQVPVHSPVVVIERLARDYAGQPLEWRRSRGHAEHFRYRVDIR